jgi:mRNA interferase MazF
LVIAKSYIPDAGDIVWLQFDPKAGREQAGHRTALVLSPIAYNAKTNLMSCCPLTTQIKSYPFEVVFTDGVTQSAVLADQLKSLDWKVRKAKFKSKISHQEMMVVKLKIKALLGL